MIRKTLTMLSLLGLLLSVGLWWVSYSEGWSHTHFYIGQDREEIGITFICADGRIGWDEAGDMSDSVLSPDHGVPLWLSAVVIAGSFLCCIFPQLRSVGTVLGRVADKLRKPLIILSLTALLLCPVAWAASYFDVEVAMAGQRHRYRCGLRMGTVYFHKSMFSFGPHRPYFHSGGHRGFHTCWLPRYMEATDAFRYAIPLWIPTATFAAAASLLAFWPGHHRRKRKKCGLCVKCGYNLRGLTGPRCPECNTPFEERLLKKDA